MRQRNPNLLSLNPLSRTNFKPKFTLSYLGHNRLQSFTTAPKTRPRYLEQTVEQQVDEQQQIAQIKGRAKQWNHMQRDVAGRIQIADISEGAINSRAARLFAITMNAIREELTGKTIAQLRTEDPTSGPQASTGEGGANPSYYNTLAQRTIGQKGTAFWSDLLLIIWSHIYCRKDGQSGKFGHGGTLAGIKVDEFIAWLRGVIQWLDLVSPANHGDRSIEDIDIDWHGIASLNPDVVQFAKLVSTLGVPTIAVGSLLCMGRTENGGSLPGIILAGGGGGSGNLPAYPKYHGAFPLWYQLYQTHKLLSEGGYRNQMTLWADGKISDYRSLLMAFLFGADGGRIGTLAMIGLRCIKADICFGNQCPVFLATTDAEKVLQYKGNMIELFNVFEALITSTAEKIATHFPDVESAIGRTDMLHIIDPSLHQAFPPIPKSRYQQKILPRKVGSSQRENRVIEEIKSGKTTITAQADNMDLSWGARTSHYYFTDPEFAKRVDRGITLNLEGFAAGQNVGYSGPPNLTIVTKRCNDNVAKQGGGVSVFAETMGHHSGAYTCNNHEGIVAARGVASRWFFLARGGNSITQSFGPYALNYVINGFHVVTGYPQHLPGIQLDGRYVPPFALKPHATDVNAFEYFQGGKIIISEALFKEGMALGHIGKTPQQRLSRQTLTPEDKQKLVHLFQEYVRHIKCPLIPALLKQQELWDQWFIKLVPPKPTPPEYWLKQQEKKQADAQKTAAKKTSGQKPGQPDESVTEVKALLRAAEEKKLEQALPVGNPTMVVDPNRDRAACGIGLIIGEPSHDILTAGLEILRRSKHRGVRFDEKIGGGCGIKIAGGEKFWAKQFGVPLEADNYAVWPILMPRNQQLFDRAMALLEESLKVQNLKIAGERVVPVNEKYLDERHVKNRRRFMQFLIVKDPKMSLEEFDRALSFSGPRFEMLAQQQPVRSHLMSFLRGVCIYKTRGLEELVGDIFPDLRNPDYEPYMIDTHVRKPTNVLKFDQALGEHEETEMTGEESTQPIYMAGFNGENNGVGVMHSYRRFDPSASKILGIDLSKIDPTQFSDSSNAAFCASLMQLTGLSPSQVHRMFFPELDPLNNNLGAKFNKLYGMPAEGPSFNIWLLGFGKHRKVIAGTDPLGQRPARGGRFFTLDPKTGVRKEFFILGSEHGIVPKIGDLELQAEEADSPTVDSATEGTIELTAGEALVIDEKTGQHQLMVHTEEEQKQYASRMQGLQRIEPEREYKQELAVYSPEELQWREALANINTETRTRVLSPLFNQGAGNTEAMGHDGPEEDRTRSRKEAINTVKSFAAQVTNVPVSFSEYSAMDNTMHVGPKPEFSELGSSTPCRGYLIPGPVVDNHMMAQLMEGNQLNTQVIDATYELGDGVEVFRLTDAIDRVCAAALQAAEQGATFIVLSDKTTRPGRPAIDPFILTGRVNIALWQAGYARQVSLGLQSAKTFSTIYHITLLALGAKVINPYLIFTPNAEYQADPKRFAKERLSYVTQSNTFVMKMGLAPRGFLTAEAYCTAPRV